MKPTPILLSVVAVVVLVGGVRTAFASEVTGQLSSGSIATSSQVTGTITGTANPPLTGGGGHGGIHHTSSGGSSGSTIVPTVTYIPPASSGGAVLGASTDVPNTSSGYHYQYTNPTPAPSVNDQAAPSTTTLAINSGINNTALPAAATESGMNGADWLAIIALIVVVGGGGYAFQRYYR